MRLLTPPFFFLLHAAGSSSLKFYLITSSVLLATSSSSDTSPSSAASMSKYDLIILRPDPSLCYSCSILLHFFMISFTTYNSQLSLTCPYSSTKTSPSSLHPPVRRLHLWTCGARYGCLGVAEEMARGREFICIFLIRNFLIFPKIN